MRRRLWLVRHKNTTALIVADNEEGARQYPLFANWQDLINKGYWDPSEARRYKVSLLGECTDTTASYGPILFENR